MHLRTPSIDRGVQSFLWAVVFFLFLYFGMVAVDVAKATALLVSLVSAFLIFLFVRTRGDLSRPPARLARGCAAVRLDDEPAGQLRADRLLEPIAGGNRGSRPSRARGSGEAGGVGLRASRLGA